MKNTSEGKSERERKKERQGSPHPLLPEPIIHMTKKNENKRKIT